ncbi:MICOS complex subunit mic25a-like isoform X2 [Brienomyrus brachyistius]|uniref:MICOS complex subunit mic25a-like isoform X2 n=1 Tax=Brienomyrus brachyistius TaxID=42636 RepID=UPI0020B2AB52|nr:MICOS complex subunit mic25a-like isoform X2 [Brienomyrus brachyistius]
MGAGESASRKVSFGLDENDRVQVLRGVKLSDDVLRRMRESTRGVDFRPPSPESSKAEPGPPPAAAGSGPGPAAAETQEELQRRFQREQSIMQEELVRVAWREREAARKELSKALLRERSLTRGEAEMAQSLAKQLEKKEAELKLLDAFYKEQLAQLAKKSLDHYKTTNQQFQEAAVSAETRIKPRRTEPVCTGLQDQILHCYRENQGQTLGCSGLAKEYMQCVNAIKKELLVTRG